MAGMFSAAFRLGKRLDGRRGCQTVDGSSLGVTRFQYPIPDPAGLPFLFGHQHPPVHLETLSETITHWDEIPRCLANNSISPDGLACTLISSLPCSIPKMHAGIPFSQPCCIPSALRLHVGG